MKRFFLAMMVLSATASCRDESESPEDGCIAAMRAEQGMVRYTGGDPGCRSYLELYLYEGEQYFSRGNHCTDGPVVILDCDGNNVCDNPNTDLCQHVLQQGESKGIVAIIP